MSYTRFARDHAYARRNGYTGCYDEYVALQYRTYAAICKRNGVRPMPRDKWAAA